MNLCFYVQIMLQGFQHVYDILKIELDFQANESVDDTVESAKEK